MKEYEKALDAYEQAYKVNSSSARRVFDKKDSLYTIGKSFYTNKDYKKALSAFSTGILYDPQFMLCYLAKEISSTNSNTTMNLFKFKKKPGISIQQIQSHIFVPIIQFH